ncbi:hypothetical protein K438DRAFT_1796250 [Mycena galopus ATCC 62051]|nr:hypothetical protein K438DRAFT_1796250 [Mycena galopus ATCC 62051]
MKSKEFQRKTKVRKRARNETKKAWRGSERREEKYIRDRRLQCNEMHESKPDERGKKSAAWKERQIASDKRERSGDKCSLYHHAVIAK